MSKVMKANCKSRKTDPVNTCKIWGNWLDYVFDNL